MSHPIPPWDPFSFEFLVLTVGYFIDISGSMTQSTIAASELHFLDRLQMAGFLEIRGIWNHDEDYITPCMTQSTIS